MRRDATDRYSSRSRPRPTAKVRSVLTALRWTVVSILTLGAFFGLRSTSLLQSLSDQGVFVMGHVTDIGNASWLGQPYVNYWYETGGQRWYATDRIDVDHRTSVLTQGKFALMILPGSPHVRSVNGVTGTDVAKAKWGWILGTMFLAGLIELVAYSLGGRVRGQWNIWCSSVPVEGIVVRNEADSAALSGHRRTVSLAFQLPDEDPRQETWSIIDRVSDKLQIGETADLLVGSDGKVHLALALSLIDPESLMVSRPCHSL